jgi:GTP-binding protein
MIEEYIQTRENLSAVFLLVDFRHKPDNNDVLMYNYLKYYDIPTIIVATKYDKVKERDKAKQEKLLKETLNIQEGDNVVLFSSITKKGREEIYNIMSNYLGVEDK